MHKYYKIFLVVASVIIMVFAVKIYMEVKVENRIKELSIQYEAQSLANLIVSFRTAYQDAFVNNKIPIDEKSIDLLPVKTTNAIAKYFSNYSQYTSFSTVSNNPRNIKNMANQRELNVIEKFKKDRNLNYIFQKDGDKYYYYKPLYITNACLKCHGKKEEAPLIIQQRYDKAYNYKLGEFRGLIDIEIKQTNLATLLTTIKSNRLVFLLIALILLIGVLFLITKYIVKLEEKKDKEHEDETLGILLHSIPMAVHGYNKNRELVYWNKTAKELYGYRFSDIKNKKIEDLILHENIKDNILNSIDNWFTKHIPMNPSQVSFKKKDNSLVDVYTNPIMIKQQKDRYIIFFIDLDLTEQEKSKRKDKILAQQSKMAAMGEMIGNIAHQWRQPLSAITASSVAMKIKMECNTLDTQSFNKHYDNINKNAQYLSKTIDDFRDFIKGDSKKDNFTSSVLINKAKTISEATIKDNHIRLIIEKNQDFNIYGSINLLIQVIVNIINNAKDILNEKNIEDKLIIISVDQTESCATISITDNAGGVPKEIISKIFDAYFTTKHQSQGTGLGLNMAYNIVKNSFDGNLDVQNVNYTYDDREYEGAKFIISIPLTCPIS